MKILLLVSDDVSAYYSASLIQRGHQIITHRRGASLKEYMECDGCLVLSDDPQKIIIAGRFVDTGKPIWRHLADVPHVKMTMTHRKLLFVLILVYLMVVGALVINQPWFREEAKPVALDEKPPTAVEVTAPVVDKANDAGRQADESSGKNCEEELRRTADLFRSFVNRIQSGEEAQSVAADMRQQEKRITAVCPD